MLNFIWANELHVIFKPNKKKRKKIEKNRVNFFFFFVFLKNKQKTHNLNYFHFILDIYKAKNLKPKTAKRSLESRVGGVTQFRVIWG